MIISKCHDQTMNQTWPINNHESPSMNHPVSRPGIFKVPPLPSSGQSSSVYEAVPKHLPIARQETGFNMAAQRAFVLPARVGTKFNTCQITRGVCSNFWKLHWYGPWINTNSWLGEHPNSWTRDWSLLGCSPGCQGSSPQPHFAVIRDLVSRLTRLVCQITRTTRCCPERFTQVVAVHMRNVLHQYY